MILRYREGGDGSLTVAREYEAFGLSQYSGRFHALVRDDHALPNWVPLADCSVVDPAVPADWLIDSIGPEDGGLQVLIGYPELVDDPDHYDALLEREPAALQTFSRRTLGSGAPFVVPEADAFLDDFGVEPMPLDDDGLRCSVEIEGAAEDIVALEWDRVRRTAHCRWTRGGAVLLELSRDGAFELAVRSGGGESGVLLRYRSGGAVHELSVRVFPEVRVEDAPAQA
ncbi:hypothetical protein [Streptomyces sp. TP-A0874]|uniref:hypothetical protein n=1 Tax=Streptomyces sp. TP-A0874 TaxID=549819 RepID=UPI0008534599|nr:hypothetical protein [Streptomyces sp. TP-A0874]